MEPAAAPPPEGQDPRAFLARRAPGRVVVKVGSSLLADPAVGLKEPTIRALATQVARAGEERGVRFVVVTSGAIAAGRRKLGLGERPRTMALKQAAAAAGQPTLMHAYERAFEAHDLQVAQLLLTHEDFESRERHQNARRTLEALLERGLVPIINENDTVATQEIRLGDNDHLAALVALTIGADLLVFLTDAGGLYTRDPRRFPDAERVPWLAAVDEELVRRAAGQGKSDVGTGGMASKLRAARLAASCGIPVVIAPGAPRRALLQILAGADLGTLVAPGADRRAPRRKAWIAHARHPQGTITVDDGARRVLVEGGRSLLPAGVVAVQGGFARGDAVSICDRGGRVFARGISRWSHAEVERGLGRRSAEVRALLGDNLPPEVVHRDDLMLL